MWIGLGGKAGSGKDTVADILCDNKDFKKFSFAKNLKLMCMKVFGLTEYDCFDEQGKETLFKKAVVLTMDHITDINDWIINVNKFKVNGLEAQVAFGKYCDDTDTVFSTPREILQFVGTEICRQIYHENFHVKVLFDEIKASGATKVVIADARFDNERKAVKDKLGFTILVVNPKKIDEKEKGLKGHKSENSLGEEDDYDMVIFNDKSKGLEVLEKQVLSIVPDQLINETFKKHGES